MSAESMLFRFTPRWWLVFAGCWSLIGIILLLLSMKNGGHEASDAFWLVIGSDLVYQSTLFWVAAVLLGFKFISAKRSIHLMIVTTQGGQLEKTGRRIFHLAALYYLVLPVYSAIINLVVDKSKGGLNIRVAMSAREFGSGALTLAGMAMCIFFFKKSYSWLESSPMRRGWIAVN